VFQLFDHQVDSDTKKRLRALRLPHAACRILGQSLGHLLATTSSRAWCLPVTRFADEVSHYSARHKALGLQGPRPVLRDSLEADLAQEFALRIDAGVKFLELDRGRPSGKAYSV
jgi:hypothetical protein